MQPKRPTISGVFALIANIDRPAIVAIDGRSSAGKSTLAARLAEATPNAAVVHADDIAWSHSRFGWTDLLVDGVITPFRAGDAVDYRPPQWDVRDRPGAVVVPERTDLLIIEGVGCSRRALPPHLDATIWIECAQPIRDARDAERIANGETTHQRRADWMSEEIPFLNDDRPWERATIVVVSP